MLREMLCRLRDETHRRIKDLRRNQEQESDSGLADVMDSASTTREIETQARLIALAEEKLKDLDEAMARLDAGKYGRCLKCDGAIPIERLMAIPFASHCVSCQEKLNRARGGWGHEPYDLQWSVPEEMEPSPERESHSTDFKEQLTIRDSEALGSGQRMSKLAKQGLPKTRRGLKDRTADRRVRR